MRDQVLTAANRLRPAYALQINSWITKPCACVLHFLGLDLSIDDTAQMAAEDVYWRFVRTGSGLSGIFAAYITWQFSLLLAICATARPAIINRISRIPHQSKHRTSASHKKPIAERPERPAPACEKVRHHPPKTGESQLQDTNHHPVEPVQCHPPRSHAVPQALSLPTLPWQI